MAKETYDMAKETYDTAKETYIYKATFTSILPDNHSRKSCRGDVCVCVCVCVFVCVR